MLNGKEFGKAIAKAIDLKLENGSAASKAAIARHFGMKPPSLADWVKKGSVSKDKLPELWRYFSDVAGPEHWGMSILEWPSGLSGFAEDEPVRVSVVTKQASIFVKTPPPETDLPVEFQTLLNTITDAARTGGMTPEQAAAFDNLIKTSTGTK